MSDRRVTEALAGSAAAAVQAPSIHNTQPWRWVLHTASLDLYADRSRQLMAIDPDGRLVLMSCGGALHHAKVSLAADGLGARVTLRPDADPDHVATLVATEPTPATEEARDLLRATLRRFHEDQTAAAGAAVRREDLDALVQAASKEGVQMRILGRSDVTALAKATPLTPKMRERLAVDLSTEYAVLYGEDDSDEAWLRAGEALSAVCLEGRRRGLSVYPSWTVVDFPGSRDVLRSLVPRTATVYLALRISSARPADS